MLTIQYGGEGNKMIKGINSLQSYDYRELNRIQNDRRSAELAAKENNERQAAVEAQPKSSAADIDLRLGDIRPRQNASLEDISLSLTETSGFEMKGRQSDITSLDMEKAVSDMQKDQALMQYQYFVGESNVVNNNEDGIVITK